MEKFTYNDLAEAINKLTPEQRDQQVCINIEDESTFRHVAGLEEIEEDIYVNIGDDEDGATLENLKSLHGDDFDIKDYRLSTPKGFPFLRDDFE